MVDELLDSNELYDEFGDKFLKMCPTEIYPQAHWRQELCKFDNYDISVLKDNGILDEYITAAGGTPDDRRYRYIKYLGDDKLDLYICRKAIPESPGGINCV